MLIITGIGSWRTILSVFVGGYFMGYLFNLWGANEFMNLPPHVHLVLGGFAFGQFLWLQIQLLLPLLIKER